MQNNHSKPSVNFHIYTNITSSNSKTFN